MARATGEAGEALTKAGVGEGELVAARPGPPYQQLSSCCRIIFLGSAVRNDFREKTRIVPKNTAELHH